MNSCPTSVRSMRRVSFGDATSETFDRRTRRLNVAGNVVGASAAPLAATAVAVAAVPAVPWTQIAGAVIGLAAGGIKLAAAFRKRGALALQGDEAAVRGFAKRAARWSSSKRARVAKRLLADYRRTSRGRRVRQSVRASKDALKLKVLYALEAGARSAPKRPAMADDPGSVPVEVERDPTAQLDQVGDTADGDPQIWWYAGGAVAIVGGAFLIRVRRAA